MESPQLPNTPQPSSVKAPCARHLVLFYFVFLAQRLQSMVRIHACVTQCDTNPKPELGFRPKPYPASRHSAWL